jgi:serine phosphatase RsbU (regulator of sigma subunit)
MVSLRQTGKENEAKDGMDISLAMIDYQNMKLQFSGAYNPLYLIKGNELTTLKGDRMPIGIYFKGQTSFTKQEVEFEKGDRIYLCSDGYEDQFGGESGRKFMSKRFQELLVSMSVSGYSMHEQKEILDKTITDWRGERDQLDDILVVGVKL